MYVGQPEQPGVPPVPSQRPSPGHVPPAETVIDAGARFGKHLAAAGLVEESEGAGCVWKSDDGAEG